MAKFALILALLLANVAFASCVPEAVPSQTESKEAAPQDAGAPESEEEKAPLINPYHVLIASKAEDFKQAHARHQSAEHELEDLMAR